MNCKPNDLAMIVKTFGGDPRTDALGKIVRLTSECKVLPKWGCVWRLAEPLVIKGYPPFDGIFDEILKPIRDPGDDAKDEMLRPLPKEVTA